MKQAGSSWSSEFGRLRTGLVNAARGLAKSYGESFHPLPASRIFGWLAASPDRL